jgi:hydroxymethylbilane synthase
MNIPVRIGTRDSQLATWQAEFVRDKLRKQNISAKLVYVKSEGDIDLTTPLTEMGGKGVFTKALDDALLEGRIDLAVHSFKDLPTENPLPLKVSAILEREDPRDTLVAPGGTAFLDDPDVEAIIATSSNRRRAQWLHRYPNHKITNIRGNVNTRLKKVHDNNWQGAIFAAAGLHRIGLESHISQYLEWMVPAPAQGAMAIMIRDDDLDMYKITSPLNHSETAICTTAEREVLNEMEGGCSAPLGAFAEIQNGQIHLYAAALTLDGSLQYDIEFTAPVAGSAGLGRRAGRELLEKGARDIM